MLSVVSAVHGVCQDACLGHIERYKNEHDSEIRVRCRPCRPTPQQVRDELHDTEVLHITFCH